MKLKLHKFYVKTSIGNIISTRQVRILEAQCNVPNTVLGDKKKIVKRTIKDSVFTSQSTDAPEKPF